MKYTTWGSVRGCCGHKHRSIEAAARCAAKDNANCAKVGGYSDRNVYEIVDGFLYVPGTDEWVRIPGSTKGVRFP